MGRLQQSLLLAIAAICVPLTAVAGAVLEPGDPVPAFCVQTTNKKQWCYDHDGTSGPVLLQALRSQDAFSRAAFSAASVSAFLGAAPGGVTYLFASWATNADDASYEMSGVSRTFDQALAAANLSASALSARRRQLVFAAQPLATLPTFLRQTLQSWGSTNRAGGMQLLLASDSGGQFLSVGRLDGAWLWVPSFTNATTGPLQLMGQPCAVAPSARAEASAAALPGPDGSPLFRPSQHWAARSKGGRGGAPAARPEAQAPPLYLVAESDKASGGCTWGQVISNAQAQGVAGVVAYAASAGDAYQIAAEGGEDAGLSLGIPVTMVGHGAGVQLALALGSGDAVTISFGLKKVPGNQLAIDSHGNAAEIPSLLHLAWAAQHLGFRQGLVKRAAQQDRGGSMVLPVFNKQPLLPNGISATVAMPPRRTLDAYATVELDFWLGCQGSRDADCPEWDHALQLFVCCQGARGYGAAGECAACQPTVWLEGQADGRSADRGAADRAAGRPVPGSGGRLRLPAGEVAWGAATLAGLDGRPAAAWAAPPGAAGAEGAARWQVAAASGALCGPELGRWMSPFRRRVGRWMTDVTPLRGLLDGDSCTFRLQTAAWAGTWVPSLSLRFSDPRGIDGEAAARPPAAVHSNASAATAAAASPRLHTRARRAAASRRVQRRRVRQTWATTGASPAPAPSSGTPAVQAAKGRTVVCQLQPVPASRPQASRAHAQRPSCSSPGWGAPVPAASVPLFQGAAFNQSYNSQRGPHTPVTLVLPAGLTVCEARLVATITGHGQDAPAGCAEFCDSEHVFTVNSGAHSFSFPEGGTDEGCTADVAGGTTPNEHGTWFFGRGGWCNGRQVDPLLADVTSDLLGGGDATSVDGAAATAHTLSYRGLYAGRDPDPAPQQPGAPPGAFVMMESSLVLYTAGQACDQVLACAQV